MKVQDSGMPEEEIWNSFFNVGAILDQLEINSKLGDIVEVGCGYGTFTLPVSQKISGTLYTFDIEKAMVEYLHEKLAGKENSNIQAEKRDILVHSTGLENNSVDYIMLFNILHHREPDLFFRECFRILKPGGKVGIIHWRSDIETPRGPDLNIRPTPEKIVSWVDDDLFDVIKRPFHIKPYHFGLMLSKK